MTTGLVFVSGEASWIPANEEGGRWEKGMKKGWRKESREGVEEKAGGPKEGLFWEIQIEEVEMKEEERD